MIFLLFHDLFELLLDFRNGVLDFCLFHKHLQFIISHSSFFKPLFSLAYLILKIFYLILSQQRFQSLLKYFFHPPWRKVQFFPITVDFFTVYIAHFVYHFRYVYHFFDLSWSHFEIIIEFYQILFFIFDPRTLGHDII